MNTHELAQLLLAKDDVEVNETLAKRLLTKPNGAKTTGVCWCGCGGVSLGRFVLGLEAKFLSLAK